MTATTNRRAGRFEPGPVLAVGAAVAGIVIGQRAGPAADPVVLALGAVALVAAIAVSGPLRAIVAALAIAALAVACTQRALNGEARSPLAAMARRAPVVTVSGSLASDPSGPAYLTSVLLRVSRVTVDDRQLRVDGRVLVRATGSDAGEWRVLSEGDGVTATGVLRPLEGRDRVQRWRHAVAVLADARLTSFASPRAPPFVVANAVRAVVLRGCAARPGRPRVARRLPARRRPRRPDRRERRVPRVGPHPPAGRLGENVAFVLALVGPLLRRCSCAAGSSSAVACSSCSGARRASSRRCCAPR